MSDKIRSAKVLENLEFTFPEFRTGYMPSLRDTDIDFGDEPTLAVQSSAKECDINSIMSQYERTGLLAHVNHFQGQYIDLGNALSYHEAVGQVQAAQEAFMSLPAYVRSEFRNDPAAFLEFVSNPDNRDHMARLGLLSSLEGGASAPQQAGDAPPSEPVKPAKKIKAASPP